MSKSTRSAVRYENLPARIAANVRMEHRGFQIDGRPSMCHIWTGFLDHGYGKISIYRGWWPASGTRKDRPAIHAHRASLAIDDIWFEYPDFDWSSQDSMDLFFMYLAFLGESGSELEAGHKCTQRACTNPAHLEWVSRKENLEERDERLRARRKELEAHRKVRRMAEIARLHSHFSGQYSLYEAGELPVDPAILGK